MLPALSCAYCLLAQPDMSSAQSWNLPVGAASCLVGLYPFWFYFMSLGLAVLAQAGLPLDRPKCWLMGVAALSELAQKFPY